MKWLLDLLCNIGMHHWAPNMPKRRSTRPQHRLCLHCGAEQTRADSDSPWHGGRR